MPYLIFKRKWSFFKKGIFPSRVFHNSIITPLFHKKLCDTVKMTTSQVETPMDIETAQPDPIAGNEVHEPEMNLQITTELCSVLACPTDSPTPLASSDPDS
ncbi:UNVERIFIED_CONTAM: hypothetical protein K2H54_056154 [Gekko kuhli]